MRGTIRSIILAAVLAACSPSGATGGGVPPHHNIWAAGDSLSIATAWPAYAGPRATHSIAVSGIAFVGTANLPFTIINVVTDQVTLHGAPATLIIMGGVGDIGQGVDPATATAAMADLDDWLAARSVNVWWVTEPSWYANRPGMDVVNAWVRTRPRVADCADSVQLDPANTYDGIHLTTAANQTLAACIYGIIP